MRVLTSCLALVLLSGVSAAQAQDDETAESRFGVGARLGLTTGLGFDASYGINRWVDVRGGFNIGYVEFDQEEDGNDYRAKLSYRSYSGLVDIKPFAGGFRLTAGLYSKPLQLKLKALSQDDFDVNDRTYNGDLDARGKIAFSSTVPYFGLGWGGTTNGNGFGASYDIGVQVTRSPKVSLTVNGRACDASVDEDCNPNGAQGFDVNGNDPRAQLFQADLDQEIRDIEHDAKDFKLVPVATFGLHYRFGLGRSSAGRATDSPANAAITESSAPSSAAPLAASTAASAAVVAAPVAAKKMAATTTASRAFVIRSQPMLSAAIKVRVPKGAGYSPSARQSNKDGVWRFVQLESGVSGWALNDELDCGC